MYTCKYKTIQDGRYGTFKKNIEHAVRLFHLVMVMVISRDHSRIFYITNEADRTTKNFPYVWLE